jgi:hypothetical protein
MHGVVQVISADERIFASRGVGNVLWTDSNLGEAESARRAWVAESITLMVGSTPNLDNMT